MSFLIIWIFFCDIFFLKSGDMSEKKTPGHIPNPEANVLSADDTVMEK